VRLWKEIILIIVLVREAAEAHNAVGLLNACKEYEEENSEYFQRLPVPQPDDLQS